MINRIKIIKVDKFMQGLIGKPSEILEKYNRKRINK